MLSARRMLVLHHTCIQIANYMCYMSLMFVHVQSMHCCLCVIQCEGVMCTPWSLHNGVDVPVQILITASSPTRFDSCVRREVLMRRPVQMLSRRNSPDGCSFDPLFLGTTLRVWASVCYICCSIQCSACLIIYCPVHTRPWCNAWRMGSLTTYLWGAQ